MRAQGIAKIGRAPPINVFATFPCHLKRMSNALSLLLQLLAKAGIVLIAANEIRGLILAGPVFYAIYQSGGTWMAIWLGICSLSGIALSVLVPIFVAKKFKLFGRATTAEEAPAR